MGRLLLMVLFATALLLVGALACSPGERALEPVLRFVTEPAPPVFDEADLLNEVEVRSWSFSQPPPGLWRIREVESVRGDGVGWWMVPEGRRVVLELEAADLLAEQVDVLAVTVERRHRGGAHLHWAAPDEPFVAQRQLNVPFSRRTQQTIRFKVVQHKQWRGPIGRLRLTLWAAARSQVGLTSIKALQQRVDGARMEETVAQSWRVDLDAGEGVGARPERRRSPWRERRLARVGWPGRAIERRLHVPVGAELRFAYGVRRAESAESLGSAFRFRVLARRDGEPSQVLFDEKWDPEPLDPQASETQSSEAQSSHAQASDTGWRDRRVDLSEWSGSSLTLRLEVSTDTAAGAEPGRQLNPRLAVPFWGHPEVLAPRLGEAPPDVVLIVADTLRADRLSLYGHDRDSSPQLDAWARGHGAVFESVTSSAGWTLPSHTSIFTGLDAPSHGVNWSSSRVTGALTTLAERLYAEGYVTEAITGGGYLDPAYGLDRGFSRYRSALRGRTRHEAEPPRTLSAALEALPRLEDRAHFLFVHTYAVHGPYAPWQPHFSSFSGHDPLSKIVLKPPVPGDSRSRHELFLKQGGRVARAGSAELSIEEAADVALAHYDSGVRRLDGLLAPLLGRLEDRPRRLVIFTSDHGEMFGEHGVWEHGHVYDPTLKVPLVIRAPGGVGAGRRIARPARSVDLLPTVLELAGLETPPGLDGRSLVPLLRGEDGAEDPARSSDEVSSGGSSGDARVAWSYGRRSDEGLTMRLRGRLKLQLHDDLFFEGPRRARAFEVGASPRDERELSMTDELDRMLDAARQKLLDELPGLHVRFANAEDADRPLHFEIESGSAIPERVKVPDLACDDCVRWKPPNGLDVEVAPGESFTVVLTDVRDARLQVTLKRSDGSRQRMKLDLTEHDRPLALDVKGESFTVVAGPPPESGFGVRWNGLRQASASVGELDRELLESLRALGYIE